MPSTEMTHNLDIVPNLFKPSLASDLLFSLHCTELHTQPYVMNSIKKSDNIKGISTKIAMTTALLPRFSTLVRPLNPQTTFCISETFFIIESRNNSGCSRNVLGMLVETSGGSEQLDPFCGSLIIEHLLMVCRQTAGCHQIKPCSTDTCCSVDAHMCIEACESVFDSVVHFLCLSRRV